MKLNKVIIFILGIIVCVSGFSRPAQRGVVTLVQPDGSTFRALFRGDEFIRIKTTVDGNVIMQDSEGWWCYAVYSEDGSKSNSGYRVGEKCPSSVMSESRHIPYQTLTRVASERRAVAVDEEPLTVRMRRKAGVRTRSDGGSEDEVMVKHGLVILAQFANLSFKHEKEDFENLLNQDGYAEGGANGCAREYFDAQFHGTVQFDFDVSDIVTLSRDLAYYGGNVTSSSGVETDRAPDEMVMEACQLADASVDFSKYDDDGDGKVDNVFIFFAGGDEAEGAGDDCIWSHAWFLKQGAGRDLVLDGMVIDRYACTSEMARFMTSDNTIEDRLAGIGSFCHEYSHTFGLADMYDTDYEGSGGVSRGLWLSTSLMDGGNQNNDGNTPPFFNAIEREMLGISEPVVIEADGSYRMAPIHKGGTFYRMNTDTEGEYFLFEARSEDSWDGYIGGRGMLVYHIDKSLRLSGYSDVYAMDLKALQRWNYYNEVNCRPDHQCADLIEAVPDAANVRSVFYPSGEVTEITAEQLAYWSGEVGNMSLTGIRMDGDDVVFNVIGNSDDTTPPVPVGLGYEKFQDAAIITFESSRVYDGVADVMWGRTGKEMTKVSLRPYEPGKYALLLDGLEPVRNYTVVVSFNIDGVSGKEGSISFLTNTYNGGFPYIYLKNVRRNPDGSFPAGCRLPLRVYNAVGAEEVVWTLDGKVINPDASGYYTLTKGKVLKAVVYWKDGSRDIIMKEINVVE